MSGRLEQDVFRAMGTTCSVAVTARPSDTRRARRALAAGRVEVEACERALSRFDPNSDLSRLNGVGGEWTLVDERLISALGAALRAREDTNGRFDPTVLPALVAAGYDRSFEELQPREPRRPAPEWRAGAAIEVDPTSSRARIEPGAAVDLGGIGKGFSAERALWAMCGAWPALPGGFADLGGDLAFWGATPDGGPWRVAVEDPRAPGRTLATLELVSGGVATSGRDRRRFGPARRLHHLIDPATGEPAGAGPLAVTVIAPAATEAEAHATALAVSGLPEARAHVGKHPGLSALFVPHFGAVVPLGDPPLVELCDRVAVGVGR